MTIPMLRYHSGLNRVLRRPNAAQMQDSKKPHLVAPFNRRLRAGRSSCRIETHAISRCGARWTKEANDLRPRLRPARRRPKTSQRPRRLGSIRIAAEARQRPQEREDELIPGRAD